MEHAATLVGLFGADTPYPRPLWREDHLDRWKHDIETLLLIGGLADYVLKDSTEMEKTKECKEIILGILTRTTRSFRERIIAAGWDFNQADADPKDFWDLILHTLRYTPVQGWQAWQEFMALKPSDFATMDEYRYHLLHLKCRMEEADIGYTDKIGVYTVMTALSKTKWTPAVVNHWYRPLEELLRHGTLTWSGLFNAIEEQVRRRTVCY